jgi:hypothetical protein
MESSGLTLSLLLLALSGSWNLSAVLGELIHEPDRVISGRVSSLSQRP